MLTRATNKTAVCIMGFEFLSVISFLHAMVAQQRRCQEDSGLIRSNWKQNEEGRRPISGQERTEKAICDHWWRLIPDSAVERETQDKAQAFCSDRNGPVPLSAVAGIGAMSGSVDSKTIGRYEC